MELWDELFKDLEEETLSLEELGAKGFFTFHDGLSTSKEKLEYFQEKYRIHTEEFLELTKLDFPLDIPSKDKRDWWFFTQVYLSCDGDIFQLGNSLSRKGPQGPIFFCPIQPLFIHRGVYERS